MKERPILFNGEMVQAVLDGRKTQTRRIVKPQPKTVHAIYNDASISTNCIFERGDQRIHCPLGQPGDRLWVRETISQEKYVHWRDSGLVVYHADMSTNGCKKSINSSMAKRPSIHMPRWASRITLEITSIKVERLQDINEEDAQAEGCVDRCAFIGLWNSIYAKQDLGWDNNPWVWAVSFERVK